ncbi:hypothetical protein ACFWAT_14010 [Streptomyces syringium]|uniref:hypothetical protein n=1 Tax=Streptomyces syringium TaxID=76729 RepID=UPI00365AAA0A
MKDLQAAALNHCGGADLPVQTAQDLIKQIVQGATRQAQTPNNVVNRDPVPDFQQACRDVLECALEKVDLATYLPELPSLLGGAGASTQAGGRLAPPVREPVVYVLGRTAFKLPRPLG